MKLNWPLRIYIRLYLNQHTWIRPRLPSNFINKNFPKVNHTFGHTRISFLRLARKNEQLHPQTWLLNYSQEWDFWSFFFNFWLFTEYKFSNRLNSTLDLSYPAEWRSCSQGTEEEDILAKFYPFTEETSEEERTKKRSEEFKKAFSCEFELVKTIWVVVHISRCTYKPLYI